jgi:hypothetical protein
MESWRAGEWENERKKRKRERDKESMNERYREREKTKGGRKSGPPACKYNSRDLSRASLSLTETVVVICQPVFIRVV